MSNQLQGPQFIYYFDLVIKALKELGGSAGRTEVIDFVVNNYEVDDNDLEMLKSGVLRINANIGWSRYYLMRDGYIDGSKRGTWSLTQKARDIDNLSPEKSLEIFQRIYKKFKTKEEEQEDNKEIINDNLKYQEIETNISHRAELIQKLQKEFSPSGFEKFCRIILIKSGFTEVKVTKQSGDGGIDGSGILKINHFVSFRVSFQSKRYSGKVPVKEIRDFRGAIAGRADKGIFMTTGTFTQDCKTEAKRDGALPIELVNGNDLLNMIEELEVGVTPITSYEIDHEYFDDFIE
jgi:restriction system protein